MVVFVILIVVLLFVVVMGGLTLANQSAALFAQSSALAMNSATSLITQCTVSLLILGSLLLVGWLFYRRRRQPKDLTDGDFVIVAPEATVIGSSDYPILPGTYQYALPDNSSMYPLLDGAQKQPALPKPQPSDFWSQKAPWEG